MSLWICAFLQVNFITLNFFKWNIFSLSGKIFYSQAILNVGRNFFFIPSFKPPKDFFLLCIKLNRCTWLLKNDTLESWDKNFKWCFSALPREKRLKLLANRFFFRTVLKVNHFLLQWFRAGMYIDFEALKTVPSDKLSSILSRKF